MMASDHDDVALGSAPRHHTNGDQNDGDEEAIARRRRALSQAARNDSPRGLGSAGSIRSGAKVSPRRHQDLKKVGHAAVATVATVQKQAHQDDGEAIAMQPSPPPPKPAPPSDQEDTQDGAQSAPAP